MTKKVYALVDREVGNFINEGIFFSSKAKLDEYIKYLQEKENCGDIPYYYDGDDSSRYYWEWVELN